MAPRFWRWRRRLSAFEIARRMNQEHRSPSGFDLVVVSDYVDIGDLKALWLPGAGSLPPVLWYCHETQSTYPLPKGRTVEADVVASDVRNALHADSIAFNSEFHRGAFLEVYQKHAALLRRWEPEWSLEPLEYKTRVIYPGIECEEIVGGPGNAIGPAGRDAAGRDAAGRHAAGVLIILWNHRWEYDKNFGAFFRAVDRLARREVPFRLVILGENPQAKPQTFLRARQELADRLETFGYAKDRATYLTWLARSDIVVSTAIQENFGIAVLEAMRAECIPLLPRRLAYPEVLPERFHDACLFEDDDALEAKLEEMLTEVARRKSEARGAPAGESRRTGETTAGHGSGRFPTPEEVARAAQRHCWDSRIREFDAWFDGAGR